MMPWWYYDAEALNNVIMSMREIKIVLDGAWDYEELIYTNEQVWAIDSGYAEKPKIGKRKKK